MKAKLQRFKTGGNALIITMVTIAVVAGFIALAIDYTRSIGRNVQRSTLVRQAINIGDAATEMAFADWRAICIKNSNLAAPPGKYFDTNAELPSPSPGNFPGVSKYNLKTFAVVPVDSTWTPIADKNTVPPKTMGQNPQNYSYYYLASADVIIPTMTQSSTSVANNSYKNDDSNGANVVAHVRRIFEKYRHNKTDKAIDYKDDLEIHPGPTFVVNGDVHTNGNLYTAHDTLTLNGTTTYSGAWSVDFMPGDSQHLSDVPASPHWGTGNPPSQEQSETPFGVSATDYHKLIDPTITSSDPIWNYGYANKANYAVKVTIDANNALEIYNSAGAKITTKTGSSADAQLAALMKSAITVNQTITDNRQGSASGNSSVRVASLDVGVITTGLTSSTYSKVDLSTNPVIYIVDLSSDPTDPTKQRGVRLKNGSILPTAGLTIASGNPVYIQGDFNTGKNGSNQPQSNITPDATNAPSANPASPTTSDYTRKPAAVIADAVTVLSNSWSDSNPANSTASNTTVNTAIIAGIVPSGNGYYSGGAENFPRFLENWSGKTLTYYGSMIELYKSEEATGHWGAANVYSAPNRAWYFDTKFLSNPPAGVPYDVDYRRGRWSME